MLDFLLYSVIVLLSLFVYGAIGNVLSRGYRAAVLMLVNKKRNIFTFLMYPMKTYYYDYDDILRIVRADRYDQDKPIDMFGEFSLVHVDELSYNRLKNKSTPVIGKFDKNKIDEDWNHNKIMMSFIWPFRLVITFVLMSYFVIISPFIVMYKLFKMADKAVSFAINLPSSLLYVSAFFKHLFAKRIKDEDDPSIHPYRKRLSEKNQY